MSDQSQTSSAVTDAMNTGAAPARVSPGEALSSAFDDTVRILFHPFDGLRWLKLSIVCLFLGGGTPSAALQWSLGSLASDIRLRHALEQVRQSVAEHTWLIILAVALGISLVLALLYLRAIFRFVLVEAIVHPQASLGFALETLQPLGLSYFAWLVGLLVALGTVFAGAAVVAYPLLRAGSAAGTRSLAFSFLLVSLLAAVVLAGLIAALMITLTDDLVVPLMYAERLRLLAAWKRVWKRMRAEAGTFAIYVVVRFVVSTLIGVAVMLFLFPALLGLFSGAIVVGALIVLILHALGLALIWNPLTTILALVALGVLLGFLLILLSVVGMPGQVLLQDFGMRFIASRVPSIQRVWIVNTARQDRT